jgi:hypothetical protein
MLREAADHSANVAAENPVERLAVAMEKIHRDPAAFVRIRAVLCVPANKCKGPLRKNVVKARAPEACQHFKSGAGPKEKATIECAEALLKDETSQASGKCLLDGITDPAAKKAAECLIDGAQNPTINFLCAAKGINPASARVISCISDNRDSQDLMVIANCAGSGNKSDTQLALSCLRENKSDWSSASVCVLKGKGGLPAPVQAGLDCATRPKATLTSFAICAGAKNVILPGDLGKLATCAAANGASAIGTATCMAGDHLNPNQQIALRLRNLGIARGIILATTNASDRTTKFESFFGMFWVMT